MAKKVAVCDRVQKHCRPVVQLSRSGKFIKEWGSTKEASLALGIAPGGITGCCQHQHHTYYGFIWEYADEYHLQ